jgi:hypothetical protein
VWVTLSSAGVSSRRNMRGASRVAGMKTSL